jgi:hypothetical protein
MVGSGCSREGKLEVYTKLKPGKMKRAPKKINGIY